MGGMVSTALTLQRIKQKEWAELNVFLNLLVFRIGTARHCPTQIVTKGKTPSRSLGVVLLLSCLELLDVVFN